MVTVHFDYGFICYPFQSVTVYRDVYFLFPAPIRNIVLYHAFLWKLSVHIFYVRGSCSHTHSDVHLYSGEAVLMHSQVYIKHF